jgi:hypothetical protein
MSKSSIFTRAFWLAAIERAIKSAAQGILVAGVGAAGFDALHADYVTLGGAGLGMALASLLTSIASDYRNDGTGPSLANERALALPRR